MDHLLAAQRLLAIGVLGWWVSRVAFVRRPADAPPAPRAVSLFAGGVTAAFAALFAWQVFWTLWPDEVPAFGRVEKLDARAWRLSSPFDRRNVVDRQGQPLAVTQTVNGVWRRVFPQGKAAAHVTGYFDRRYGKTGVEGACDDLLATWRTPAWDRLRDAAQRPDQSAPVPLRLTIDARLQKAAAAALAGQRGAVVGLSPATGDVLVLVSSPSYDPNGIAPESWPLLARDPASPLLNRALAGQYPPGSTLKPLVAAAALAQGHDPATRYPAPADGYRPPGDTQAIRDFEAGELESQGRTWHGRRPLDLAEALACSANTYFARLGVELGDEPLLATARDFGLDRRWELLSGGRRGHDLSSAPGTLPTPPLKAGVRARCAIGQDEVLVTPLHLAVMAATIANYGRLAPPRLRFDLPPPAPTTVLDAEVAQTLQHMMAGVVTSRLGTGRGLRLTGLPVAAKTGSAENPHGAAHAWVVAFAPVDRAVLALAVLVENGGTGSEAAVPVARSVLRAATEAGYLRSAGETP